MSVLVYPANPLFEGTNRSQCQQFVADTDGKVRPCHQVETCRDSPGNYPGSQQLMVLSLVQRQEIYANVWKFVRL